MCRGRAPDALVEEATDAEVVRLDWTTSTPTLGSYEGPSEARRGLIYMARQLSWLRSS